MNSNFAVITPTGDRPEVFELCKFYMNRQTLKPAEWIIVDDGKTPAVVPNFPFVKYIRRVRKPTDPAHTLPVQMLEALKQVTTGIVIMMEDDDWYCPEYLENMIKLLEERPDAQIVGQGHSMYYHPPKRKYFIHPNEGHASWCQTGFRASLISEIVNLCQGIRQNPFIDLRLWRSVAHKYIHLGDPCWSVGMKGLPGRLGAVGAHTNKLLDYTDDPEYQFLESIIGADVELYKKFKDFSVISQRYRRAV